MREIINNNDLAKNWFYPSFVGKILFKNWFLRVPSIRYWFFCSFKIEGIQFCNDFNVTIISLQKSANYMKRLKGFAINTNKSISIITNRWKNRFKYLITNDNGVVFGDNGILWIVSCNFQFLLWITKLGELNSKKEAFVWPKRIFFSSKFCKHWFWHLMRSQEVLESFYETFRWLT